MELFTINRYGETKPNEDDADHEDDLLLQRLQRKKKMKKQQSEKPTVDDHTNGIDGLVEQPPATEEVEENGTDSAIGGDDDTEADQEVEQAIEQELPSTESKPVQTDFTILGVEKLRRLQRATEVLPPWLSHPTVIEHDLTVKGPSIKKLTYLDDALLMNLKKMGYKRFFPVQSAVIPWLLDAHKKPAPFWPRDVCISSPTGSGKTLAFAVPVVQLLLRCVAPAIRALVILPVSELAEQVYGVFEKLCEGTTVRPLLLTRRQSFAVEQRKLIDRFNNEYLPKVSIVVTTAGRLVEHLHSTVGFTLGQLQFLIIDEADRVMDQIQNDWIYHLNKHVKQESDDYLLGRSAGGLSQTELFDKPRQPHKLLFSATLSRDPEKLQTFKLFHPKLFTTVLDAARVAITRNPATEQRGTFVGQYVTPLELREQICMTQFLIKPLTLFALIKQNHYRKFLVFTNGIDASHRLSFVLQRLFGAELIIEEWSSLLSPATRKGLLSRFNLGKVNGIICTDALARGIDIDDIEVVVSYDMPRHINTYIHRIGRTGRAGNRGTSITMLIDEERKKFDNILLQGGKRSLETIEVADGMEEQYSVQYKAALEDLRLALDIEKQTIHKLRNGMSVSNLVNVNLLSKLKNRVKITDNNSSEFIRLLEHLPKSWTKEAMVNRAAKTRRPKATKRQLEPIDGDGPAEKATNDRSPPHCVEPIKA